MGTRHIHADVIHAWAEGEEIESRYNAECGWRKNQNPRWDDNIEYRIKPKTIKKEGWVNVYPSGVYCFPEQLGSVWSTESSAEKYVLPELITRIRIEWEEEE